MSSAKGDKPHYGDAIIIIAQPISMYNYLLQDGIQFLLWPNDYGYYV